MNKHNFSAASKLLAAATLSAISLGASAQTYGPGYFDFKLGSSDFSNQTGNIYRSDSSDTSFGITFGQDLNPNAAVEFSYTDFGSAVRGGGDLKASAASASYVAKLPVDRITFFGKVGLAYGWTDSRPARFSDVPSGSDSGFGPHLGLGASFDINKQLAIVGQWEQTSMPFAGEGQEHVDNTSIGLRVKF